MPDLTNLIADYCDEESLSKLARVIPIINSLPQVNKDVRKIIVEESKDRYIKILEYKYYKVCSLLDVTKESMTY